MREFVFALEYEPGTNPVADVLEAHAGTRIRSLSYHVTPDSLWRVDYATGSNEALEALEAAYAEPAYFADCLVRDDCGATCETQVLDRSNEELVVYTYWDRTDVCTSVPHLALEYLGTGLLFETYRESRRHRWRIVLDDDTPVREFFDALGAEVGECTGIEMLRLADVDPDRSLEGTSVEPDIPPEQRDAVRAAVEHGYYETPRAIELDELAAQLEIPRSTLSYRLRRAEAAMASSLVAGDRPRVEPEI
ncbi:helix-turn-helix domain-containing protein [Halobacteria archaeon AArc-curdl1]|uniref:Helix-turn-helix domain-containing protein n=1 Tax=Natronosalvus hydrolyticus TaxID=2979988 RepID=A0AAP2Z4I7_9EURY|nr:helix-turn-helix domain-containing protein [Halobacteria archaeon AArc-curdl1]